MRCNLSPSIGLRASGAPESPSGGDVNVGQFMAPRERVRRLLRRRGPMAMEEIAEALGMPLDQVRPVVYEMRREHQVVRRQTFSLVRSPAR